MSDKNIVDKSNPVAGSNFVMYNNTPQTGVYESEFTSGEYETLEDSINSSNKEEEKRSHYFDGCDA